jgi:hypothetical protein
MKIGERWFTLLSAEELSCRVGMMDEFKNRQLGAPLIVLGNRPEPPEMNRYATDQVPDHQLVFVDVSHALRERSFIPPNVKESETPENWTKGITFGWSDAFERMSDRAVIGVDETLAFAEHGFPSWYVIGGTRQWAA